MRTVAVFVFVGLVGFACNKDSANETAPEPKAHMPALPAVAGGEISGSVAIAEELAGEVKAGDAIFVMARNAATGSLIAVTRIQAADAPVNFKLKGNATMHNNSSLVGKVRLQARLDKDGDAITHEAGDIVGEVDELVQVPASDIQITLTKKL